MKNRNDLAHGTKSFADIGKDISIEDLLKIKGEVIEYISQILKNIEDYLVLQEYLHVS
jgi:MAE_28990/MAE_18760-like HEPN